MCVWVRTRLWARVGMYVNESVKVRMHKNWHAYWPDEQCRRGFVALRPWIMMQRTFSRSKEEFSCWGPARVMMIMSDMSVESMWWGCCRYVKFILKWILIIYKFLLLKLTFFTIFANISCTYTVCVCVCARARARASQWGCVQVGTAEGKLASSSYIHLHPRHHHHHHHLHQRHHPFP